MNKFLNILFVFFLYSLNIFSQTNYSGERLQAYLNDYIQSFFTEEIETEYITPLRNVEFNASKIKAKIENYHYNNGIANLDLCFYLNDDNIKTIKIKTAIFVIRDLIVAKNTLAMNSDISENDVISKPVQVNPEKAKEYLTYEEVVGQKSARTIAKNTPFTKEMFKSSILIKRGEKVNVYVQAGTISIHTNGTALQDASVGGTIRIKRDGNTSQILEGIVNSDGSVTINAG